MAVQATFSSALLAEAIGKACRVAPTKGAAADRSGGLLLELNASLGYMTVRSTDLEVTFSQTVETDEVEGESATWRVSSIMMDAVMSTLPQGENDPVTLIGRDDTKLRIKSGTSLTAITLMDADSFPKEPSSADMDFIEANDLPLRVDQVGWAVSKNKGSQLSGIRIDGTHLYACNEQAVASVPCQAAVEKPVTAPLETLRSLLRQASDVSLAASEGRLFIRMDEGTMATTTLIQMDYPDVKGLFRQNFLGSFKVHKMALIEKLDMIQTVLRLERQQRVKLTLDPSGLMPKLVLDAEASEKARTRVELSVQTEFDKNYELTFIPGMLRDSISNAYGEYITIDFGVDIDPEKRHSIRVTDERNYMAYVMPLAI